MTSTGVDEPVSISRRIYPVRIPKYSFPRPRAVKLAAVKDGIFNPRLPTLRRMEMDTERQLLPEEHCQSMTHCRREDFTNATSSLLTRPPGRMNCMEMTDTGKSLHQYYTTHEELKRARIEWSEFLDKCPERYFINLPDFPKADNYHFYNYYMRYLKPDLTKSWNYTLRQEPSLDMYGQRPIPANTHDRYRSSYPQFSQEISSQPWTFGAKPYPPNQHCTYAKPLCNTHFR